MVTFWQQSVTIVTKQKHCIFLVLMVYCMCNLPRAVCCTDSTVKQITGYRFVSSKVQSLAPGE